VILRWNGSQWQAVSHPLSSQLFDVHAVAADDVWAVGTNNVGTVILHWDGTEWASVPAPDKQSGGRLDGIDALGGEDLWAVGSFYDDEFVPRTLAVQAPSTTQGQVIGTTNVGQAVISWFGKRTGSTTADAFGDFDIPGLPAGRYTITAANPFGGCDPASERVRISAGETTMLDLQLDCEPTG
jgi:hypothetical protein